VNRQIDETQVVLNLNCSRIADKQGRPYQEACYYTTLTHFNTATNLHITGSLSLCSK
jgi:hypothetical protein